MADEDTTGRAREALAPFLAAALRARAPAELSAGKDVVGIEVSAADIRRALKIYEKDLHGDRLVDWINEGRAARARDEEEEPESIAFVLEVAPANGGAPASYECADLDQVRERVEAAAATSAEAMRDFLGADSATPEELATQLGRQAFRRLASQIKSQQGPARFDLPDRPWLRLSVAGGP
jgi:hypothetical protein